MIIIIIIIVMIIIIIINNSSSSSSIVIIIVCIIPRATAMFVAVIASQIKTERGRERPAAGIL